MIDSGGLLDLRRALPSHRHQSEVRLRLATVEGRGRHPGSRSDQNALGRNLRQTKGRTHQGDAGNLHGKQKKVRTALN